VNSEPDIGLKDLWKRRKSLLATDPHRQKADRKFFQPSTLMAEKAPAFGIQEFGREAMTLFLLASRQEKIEIMSVFRLSSV